MNIEEHLPLVRALVRRLPYHVCDREDLFQQGCVGLLAAAARFDPTRGVAFSTYAVPFILGEMRKLCRQAAPVHIPRQEQEVRGRLRRAMADMTATLHREPTMDELSAAVRVPAEELPLLMEEITAVPLDELTNTGAEDPHFALAEVLGGLSSADRCILVMRHLHGMTQQEIAERLGVSQMEVSRRLRRLKIE